MENETSLNSKAAAPEKMAENRTKNLKPLITKLTLDMIPVIAGILIALFINNLQEGHRDQNLLESTLESLADEFEKNQKNIEVYLPRQQRFLDTLQLYMNDKSYSISDITDKVNGMGTPEIYSTNWRSSLSNNSLRLMNFKAINLFSRIDSKHEELKTQENFIYPMVYGPAWLKRGQEGWEYRKSFEAWTLSYMGNERELLALYKEFEELLHNNAFQGKDD
jgi:hypothetical protein